MMKNYAVLLGVFLLAACGKTERADSFNDIERQFPVTGELNKAAKEIITNEYADQCDQQLGPKMRELSYRLDARVAEINAFISKMPSSDNADSPKKIPFGKSFLREAAENPNAKDEWKMDVESWSDAYHYYLKIKNQPMNRDWVNLNSWVRSMLLNDQMRVLDGMNVDLVHDSGDKIDSLIMVVQACVDETGCKTVRYSANDLQFISNVMFYRYYKKKFEKTGDMEILKRFLRRLKYDAGRFSFRANKTVTIAKSNGKTIITLPLDGSVFDEEQKKQVESYVEPVWDNKELSLKLDWKDAVTDIFKMFFEMDKPGERAYVMSSSKEVHLFPLTRTRSIAHEFGHVLGFSDHYYTTYDFNQCAYKVEWNAGDLMSDTEGKVTDAEWNDLHKYYVQ